MLNQLTHREKILWINVLTVAFLFGYYFITVAFRPLAGEEAIWLYVKVVIYAIVIEVVAISVISVLHKPEPADERDRQIELKAHKWGYYIVVGGLVLILWQVALNAIADASAENSQMGESVSAFLQNMDAYSTPFINIHIILFTLALAEVVKASTQLIYYRKGA